MTLLAVFTGWLRDGSSSSSSTVSSAMSFPVMGRLSSIVDHEDRISCAATESITDLISFSSNAFTSSSVKPMKSKFSSSVASGPSYALPTALFQQLWIESGFTALQASSQRYTASLTFRAFRKPGTDESSSTIAFIK